MPHCQEVAIPDDVSEDDGPLLTTSQDSEGPEHPRDRRRRIEFTYGIVTDHAREEANPMVLRNLTGNDTSERTTREHSDYNGKSPRVTSVH